MKNKVILFLIYLIYFATPFESVAIIPGISVVKIVTIIFLMITLFIYQKFPLPKNSLLILFLFFTLYTTISTIWSIDKKISLQYSLGTLAPTFIITIFIYRFIQNKKHIINIFKAYGWSSFLVSLIALYMFATGFRFIDDINKGRLTVLGQDQNELSFLLSFGVVSLLYLINFAKSKMKIIYWILILIISFVILMTGSRTGFVILLSISFISIIMQTKKSRLLYLIPLFIIAIIIFLEFIPEKIIERLLQTSDQISNKDLTGRVFIWERGWQAFKNEDSLLFGVGFKTFPILMENHYGIYKASHNTYLGLLIELGLFGSTLFFLIISNLLSKIKFLISSISIFYILLILPLLFAMFTLSLGSRRWLFLIGILIMKIYQTEKSLVNNT